MPSHCTEGSLLVVIRASVLETADHRVVVGLAGSQHGAREVGVIGRGRTALPFEPQTNHIVDARKRIPGLVGEIAVGEILACDVGFTPDRVVCAP